MGFFAWVHGAGEVISGKVNASIARLVGDYSTLDIEEETERRGKREMINQEFEPKPPSLTQKISEVSRKADMKQEKSRN